MEAAIASLEETGLRGVLKYILTSSEEGAALVEQALSEMGEGGLEVKAKGRRKSKARKAEKENKAFDMSRYHQRHVAMQIQYDGGPYHGFAAQAGEDDETVEKHIFNTLLKLRLITDKKECSYSRCGRTDKGVSALGQVIGLKVRSNLPIEADLQSKRNLHPCDGILRPMKEKEEEGDSEEMEDATLRKNEGKGKKKKKVKSGGSSTPTDMFEIDYCGLMNKNLPESIRVLGWCETSSEFSARFSASYRMYRYFFTAKNLDIAAMQKGASLMIGEHDFRNLCKMNIAEVSNFRREVYCASILPFHEDKQDPRRSVFMLEIRGVAFLWHMVRCIMSVLLLIGEGKEQPEVVLDLLDVDSNPGKPMYQIADEAPLVLHECGFDNLRLLWQPSVLWTLTNHFETLYDRHIIAAARALNSIQYLRGRHVRKNDVATNVPPSSSPSLPSPAAESEPPSKKAKVEGGSVAWSEVLDSLQHPYPFPSVAQQSSKPKDTSSASSPFSRSSSGGGNDGGSAQYVPLMQRNKCEVYEEKVKHISGSKKERFKKHVKLKGQATQEGTAAFFQKSRQEGSL